MKISSLSLFLLGVLFAGQSVAAGESNLDKARSITSICSRCEIVNMKKVDWAPLNDNDLQYTGPVDDVYWADFAENVDEAKIASARDLHQVVAGMGFSLQNSQKLKLQGVTAEDVRKWLDFINTGVFGRFQLQVSGKEAILQAAYPSTSRIFAAFRNPELESMLTTREKQTLQICADWICGNIQFCMPAGLKLKKVHDALVDNSVYTNGFHEAADVIVDGRGACSAYASATQLLLSMMRIDCRLVQGSRKMNHVWNLVKVDDNWYHLDTTWNDPICTPPARMYDYFLLTDAEMAADHEWDKPEIYPETPKLNETHFYKRNDLRRGWETNAGGYTLPREDEELPQSAANRSKNAVAAHGEKLLGAAGIQTDARQKVKELMPQDRKKVELKGRKVPKVKRSGKADLKKLKCTTPADIDMALEARLNELDESELVLDCGSETSSWQMRRLLALSELPRYAQKYSAVCDDKACTITITPKFWPHMRILAAARNSGLQCKLSPDERKAVEQCTRWASTYGTPWKTNRQKIRDLHMALIGYFQYDEKGGGSLDVAVVGKRSDSRGYAQAMFVVCQLMNLPCALVHGRTKRGYQVWNMVRVDRRNWYHTDAAYDDKAGCKSEFQCKCLLSNDAEMRASHAWDPTEMPHAQKIRN